MTISDIGDGHAAAVVGGGVCCFFPLPVGERVRAYPAIFTNSLRALTMDTSCQLI